MPIRKIQFVNEHYYHIFNRGVNKQPIFFNRKDYLRMLNTIEYYQHAGDFLKFSNYINLPSETRKDMFKQIQNLDKHVDIVSYILMPNHFHLLVKQNMEMGISRFLSNLQNSYTRYYNLKHDRTGHLFQGQFKSALIESDEQLLHVSRYIHLNPYSSALVKNIENLIDYEYSSFLEYQSNSTHSLCNKSLLINNNFFKNAGSYLDFVNNNADYQKRLSLIRHLVIE
jgi:putative transposase